MRTVLTQAQVTAIINKAFDEGMNFCMYHVGPDGMFEGVTVDHLYSVDLPPPDEG